MDYLFGGKMIEQFIQLIIRPLRSNDYYDSDLGPAVQQFQSTAVRRQDFTVTNQLHQTIKCTLYCPQSLGPQHCVVYLHDGATLVPLLCQNGLSLCVFDFSGSGKSDGKYVSLGVQESKDLDEVLRYLQTTCQFTTFTLWGRSMGAVTALHYQHRYANPNVTDLICDSAFSSLSKVCLDMSAEKSNLPRFLVDLVMPMIEQRVKSTLKCNPYAISPHNLSCTVPALFIYSDEDKLILPYHSKAIIEAYKGPHSTFKIRGGHNDTRDHTCLLEALNFIQQIQRKTRNYQSASTYHSERYFSKQIQPQGTTTYRPESRTRATINSQVYRKENVNPIAQSAVKRSRATTAGRVSHYKYY